MTNGTVETFKSITINGDLITSGEEIENEIYLLARLNELKTNKILNKPN